MCSDLLHSHATWGLSFLQFNVGFLIMALTIMFRHQNKQLHSSINKTKYVLVY